MTELRNKNVLITGAASGIGRSMAVKIAVHGGQVILWDINHDAVMQLCDDLKERGLAAKAYTCDLADRSAIATTAAMVIDECGPVDVLINNAGVTYGKWLMETSEEEIIRTFNINALALFWMTRAFLPTMLAHDKGHIVTIASAATFAALPRVTDYMASKFAAVGFNEALRIDLRSQGSSVRTTCVYPYFINTGLFAGAQTRFSWLLPILEPEYVAERIVSAIRNDRQRLIIPRFAVLALAMRWLPPFWFDLLMDFFGINQSMEEFTGRPSK
jgi:all-trans-retinol dehydrogenase (NAD+)